MDRMEEYSYWMDRRVIASSVVKPDFNEKAMTLTIEVDEDEYVFPAKYDVCGLCEGAGKHVNPSIDASGLGEEYVSDPEFLESYRNGGYDVVCNICDGKRVIPVINESKCNKEDLKIYKQWLKDEYEFAYMSARERAMGA